MATRPYFSVAPAVAGTSAPPIPKAREWAAQYLASSPSLPILNLSQGVPGDPPHPDLLKNLAISAADPESARYGPILGEPQLRQAMANEIRSQYRLGRSGLSNGHSDDQASGDVTADDVGITTGCNMAFLLLLMTLCPPGRSSALIPLPAYFNHDMSLSLQSIKPVYIPCDPAGGFRPSLQAAREHLELAKKEDGPIKPKMIVLVTPNNPTGAVYPADELEKWFDLAKEFGIALILDETYRDFVEPSNAASTSSAEEEGRGRPHRLFERPDWRTTLVSLSSFSKGYRIPGHRLGSIIASPELLNHIATVADCMQICPPRPPQLAIIPLVPSLRADLATSSRALASRHHLFKETVEAVKGWKVLSQGAYYAYVSFPSDYQLASGSLGLKRKRLGSEHIAKALALRCGVIILPGAFFTPPMDELEEVKGAERLMDDTFLRFAIANVDDEAIRQLGPRLQRMNEIMGLGEA